MKMTWKLRFWAIAPLALCLALATLGCQKGPAEQAGQRVDEAARETRDTLNPPANPVEAAGRKLDDLTTQGPAERTGEAVDDVTRGAGDAIDDVTNPPNP